MTAETEFLTAYLPSTLVRGLVANPGSFGAPHGRECPAVLLFADIVGFTALTGEYARRGQGGVEELTALLDACFGRLVELVLDHGGDVLRFPGDAVLALWDAEAAERIPDSVQLAAQCALALQAAFVAGDPRTAGRRLRIAISAGPVTIAYAGGADRRWEFLALGEPFGSLGGAVERAAPGESVLTPAAWAAVRDRVRGAERDDHLCLSGLRSEIAPTRCVAPPPPAGLGPALRAFVPRSVLARLDAGHLDWLAEFRQVSVLFLELAGIGRGAVVEMDRLQDAMRETQAVLYRFGGGVNQVVVDDKGLVVVAVWGCGLHTHEDDGVRAVRAAMSLEEGLRPVVPAAAIGVASGRAFCGRRGSGRRAEYAVIGDAVNLAARLMKAAEAGILCDQATVEAARSRVDFDARAPISVKGRDQPVAVYGVRAARRTQLRGDGVMVGREQERRELRARVDALLRGGSGGVVVIEGDAGIGKSRLVADMLDHARAARRDPDHDGAG